LIRQRAVALVSLVVVALASTAHANEPTRPNILRLVAEDLSPRIGSFDDPVARTPNLDRLAEEGVRFTNVFTTAGVCAPSRAGLILGRHQISTGTQHMRSSGGGYLAVPPPDAKAFPELLRAAGYFTYQNGKLDYQFSGTMGGSGPSSIWDAEDEEAQWALREGKSPFFGMVNFMVTHESGVMAPLGTWPHGIVHLLMQGMQWNARQGFTDVVAPTNPASVVLPPYYPDLPDVRTDLARHYDNVQIMDAQVGVILERLERDGLADDTIVIWTTDHGDGLPRAKRDLFDSGLEVPMIIRWPESLRPERYATGDTDDQLVSFVDLTVAILAMAGVEAPDGMHGQDFLDPTAPPRAFVYASRDRIDDKPDRQRAVRDDRYKYIWSGHPNLPESDASAYRDNQDGMRAMRRAFEAGELTAQQRLWFEAPGEERLFDLERDPHELNDVSGDPTYADALADMRAAYQTFRERVPDLSDEPEEVLAERSWPGGEQPVTADPTIRVVGDQVIVTSETPGASLEVAWDGGPWRLHTGPIAARSGARLAARAVRYGYEASDEVDATLP
jgi:arylsulfatase A-like enzyme